VGNSKKIIILFYSVVTVLVMTLFTIPGGAAETALHIVNRPVIDVLRKPEEGAERVTQLLYNDRLTVFKIHGKWAQIQAIDQSRSGRGYPGWVRVEGITPVSSYSYEGELWTVINQPVTYLYPDLQAANPPKKVYFGTILRYLDHIEDKNRKWGNRPVYWIKTETFDGQQGWVFYYHAQIREKTPFIEESKGRAITHTAALFENVPYLWGGMSIVGIDCSGLTHMVYRFHGYVIPRDADDQFRIGTPVSLFSLKPGDLMFYGENNKITHVGIYAGDMMLLHARSSKGVVYDYLFSDHLHSKYMGARRIIPDQ
jgi:gamma-D-glutamyl-L-lysine dipeptidyl-peptidase